MADPLAEIVTLLRPRMRFSKVASGAGAWRLHKEGDGHLFYGAVVEGSCRLQVPGREALTLEASDFVLIPAMVDFTMTSLHPGAEDVALSEPTRLPSGEFRLGDLTGPVNMRNLIGHCVFASPDAALLVSLLPGLVHVRGEARLATLVAMVGGRSPRGQAGSGRGVGASAGGDADRGASVGCRRGCLPRSVARFGGWTGSPLRSGGCMRHRGMGGPWRDCAREAGLSRSAFFDRFGREVGMAPMEYLLTWRMALAKGLLRRGGGAVAAVAEKVGYRSASAFSVAFARHVGKAPARYAREA